VCLQSHRTRSRTLKFLFFLLKSSARSIRCIHRRIGTSKRQHRLRFGRRESTRYSQKLIPLVPSTPFSHPRFQARLVETGAKKLAQLFTKLVASGSTGSHPAGSDFQYFSFPRDELAILLPLVKVLRGLPLPATHPSHLAAAAILSSLKEAQRGYAEMRGSWARKSLEVYARRVIDRAETTDGVASGRELGGWTSDLLSVIEVRFSRRCRNETKPWPLQAEYDLLVQLAPLPSPSHLPSTYAILLIPLTTLFKTTLSSLSALIKRSLHKYTFHALASYSSLSAHQDRWDELITRRAERKENELKEDLHALRGVCLRSFPEFLADLKLAGLGRGGDVGTGCADFTISVRYPLTHSAEIA
jgi:exocyst complex protein 7